MSSKRNPIEEVSGKMINQLLCAHNSESKLQGNEITIENKLIKIDIDTNQLSDSPFDFDLAIINFRIIFKNCTFNNTLLIRENEFLHGIEFKNCKIEGQLIFFDAILTGNSALKETNIRDGIMFIGTQIQKFEINSVNTKHIWLENDNVHQFDVEHVDAPEGSRIWFKKNCTQNYSIQNSEFGEFLIGGVNSTGSLNISNCQINKIMFLEFINDNKCTFIGLSPTRNGDDSFFYILLSQLGKAQFHQIVLDRYSRVCISKTTLLESAFYGTRWPKHISSIVSEVSSILIEEYNKKYPLEDQTSTPREFLYQQRETYRQLRFLMEKQGDRLNELIFYEKEMNIHNRLLHWSSPLKDSFWDKLILYASNYFSRYGQSFMRPLLWLFFFNTLFFYILVVGFNYKNIDFLLHSKSDVFDQVLGDYFLFLNPTRRFDDSLVGWAVLWDLLSRISVGFFLYNMIKATRRFVK